MVGKRDTQQSGLGGGVCVGDGIWVQGKGSQDEGSGEGVVVVS